jgi:ribosome-associated heat shock protein Hsp15
MQGQRLDKWLWCARLARTRVSAAKLIADGKILVNGTRAVKLAHPVRLGDVVTGTAGGRLFVLRVTGASARRGPAGAARLLYEDLTPQPPPEPERVVRGGPRPTKRDRRRIDALRAEETEWDA